MKSVNLSTAPFAPPATNEELAGIHREVDAVFRELITAPLPETVHCWPMRVGRHFGWELCTPEAHSLYLIEPCEDATELRAATTHLTALCLTVGVSLVVEEA